MDDKNGEAKYRVTKAECEAKLSGVCSQCGGGLSAIETVDNGGNPTHWSGCAVCMRFDYGVDPVVYDIARRLVQKEYYLHYHHEGTLPMDADTEDMRLHKEQCQISGACGIVARVRAMLAEQADA